MNRRDLQDILDTDLLASGLSAAGLFFLSGSSWLFVETLINQVEHAVTPAIIAYAVIAISGMFLLGAGTILTVKKRNKIASIFDETQALGTTYTTAPSIGVVSPLPQLPQSIGQGKQP